MVRRALSATVLVGLAAAGVASASLLAAAQSAPMVSSLSSATGCSPGSTSLPAPSTQTASGTTTGAASTAPSGSTASTGTASANTAGSTSVVGSTTITTTVGQTTTVLPGSTVSAVTTSSCGASAAPAQSGTSTTTAEAPLLASVSASTLVLTGHGFGHGMGMGQWGAYGYATHGWDDTQILLHYYRGTTIGDDATPSVRVLLSAGHARITLASTSPWHVVDADGTSLTLPSGSLVLPAGLAVEGHELVSPLSFSPGPSPLVLGGRPYRGTFQAFSTGKTLELVNVVSMSSYLDGVVGAEMPSYWPAAALEAQAIAARSYALAQIDDVVTASAFDLYGDARSQVYGGIAAETPSVLAAVRATARQVVLYDGQVATTYYSASTGGETVSAAEALGTPVPYLVSVPDPYDVLSPFHDWGPVLVGAGPAGRALGLAGPLLELQTLSGPSGHVATATAIGAAGELTLSGAQVEADLGLRSTWFRVGWLALTPPPAPLLDGTSFRLDGVLRGVSGVQLEAQSAGGAWVQMGAVLPGQGGAFSVTVSPRVTTRYRLAAGSIRAALVTVAVAPTLRAALAAGGVEGTVSPAAAAQPVELERQSGQAWSAVATATTGAGGGFELKAQLAPGTYRVRSAPWGGLAAGLSAPLVVP